jgi:mono/diheme cytochrome c family protein
MESELTRRAIVSLALSVALSATVASFAESLAKPLSYRLPDETAAFRPGPGVEQAQNNCAACHSADYINFQPPNKGTAFWDAEVEKMIKAYRAPIGEKDAKSIADYLARTY